MPYPYWTDECGIDHGLGLGGKGCVDVWDFTPQNFEEVTSHVTPGLYHAFFKRTIENTAGEWENSCTGMLEQWFNRYYVDGGSPGCQNNTWRIDGGDNQLCTFDLSNSELDYQSYLQNLLDKYCDPSPEIDNPFRFVLSEALYPGATDDPNGYIPMWRMCPKFCQKYSWISSLGIDLCRDWGLFNWDDSFPMNVTGQDGFSCGDLGIPYICDCMGNISLPNEWSETGCYNNWYGPQCGCNTEGPGGSDTLSFFCPELGDGEGGTNTIYGCFDTDACNLYNGDGVCPSGTNCISDDCIYWEDFQSQGVCDCPNDDGEWPILDCAGECGGNNKEQDCGCGIPGTLSYLDCVNETGCEGNYCPGQENECPQKDVCNVCGGDGSTCCNNECGSHPYLGMECNGEGTCICNGEFDCAGVCNGDAVEDCAGICNGDTVEDECGICGGLGPLIECSDGRQVCHQRECEPEPPDSPGNVGLDYKGKEIKPTPEYAGGYEIPFSTDTDDEEQQDDQDDVDPVGTCECTGTGYDSCNNVMGDVNGDGSINVTDIVKMVSHILEVTTMTDICQLLAADTNSDGSINVSDIVAVVNCILDVNNCPTSSGRAEYDNSSLIIGGKEKEKLEKTEREILKDVLGLLRTTYNVPSEDSPTTNTLLSEKNYNRLNLRKVSLKLEKIKTPVLNVKFKNKVPISQIDRTKLSSVIQRSIYSCTVNTDNCLPEENPNCITTTSSCNCQCHGIGWECESGGYFTCDDGTCAESIDLCDNQPVLGCTYPDACNYDMGAEVNDGSCIYPECRDPQIGCECDCLGNLWDCDGVCGGNNFECCGESTDCQVCYEGMTYEDMESISDNEIHEWLLRFLNSTYDLSVTNLGPFANLDAWIEYYFTQTDWPNVISNFNESLVHLSNNSDFLNDYIQPNLTYENLNSLSLGDYVDDWMMGRLSTSGEFSPQLIDSFLLGDLNESTSSLDKYLSSVITLDMSGSTTNYGLYKNLIFPTSIDQLGTNKRFLEDQGLEPIHVCDECDELEWENLSSAELTQFLNVFINPDGQTPINGDLDQFLSSYSDFNTGNSNTDWTNINQSFDDFVPKIAYNDGFRSEYGLVTSSLGGHDDLDLLEKRRANSLWFYGFLNKSLTSPSSSLYNPLNSNNLAADNLDSYLSSWLGNSSGYNQLTDNIDEGQPSNISESISLLPEKSYFLADYDLVKISDATNNNTYCNYYTQCGSYGFHQDGLACSSYPAAGGAGSCITVQTDCANYSDTNGACISQNDHTDFCNGTESCYDISLYTINQGACSTYTSNEGTCMGESSCNSTFACPETDENGYPNGQNGTCFDSDLHTPNNQCTENAICGTNGCYDAATDFRFGDVLCVDENGDGVYNPSTDSYCGSIIEYCNLGQFNDCNDNCLSGGCYDYCLNTLDSDGNGILDFMLRSDCIPSYTCDDSANGENGNCFDSDIHMFKNACNSTVACPEQTNGVDNGQNGTCFDSDDHIFKNECGSQNIDSDPNNDITDGTPTTWFGEWCLNGICQDCPPHTDQYFQGAELGFNPNCWESCDSFDACDSDTCYQEALHMTNQECVGWGFGDGTVQDCPPHKSDGGGPSHECYDKCTAVDACTDTEGGETGVCYNDNVHMLDTSCGGEYGQWCIDGTCYSCPAADSGAFLSNCVTANGADWMLQTSCEGNCDEGVCDDGDYEDFMLESSCQGLCTYDDVTKTVTCDTDFNINNAMLESNCGGTPAGGSGSQWCTYDATNNGTVTCQNCIPYDSDTYSCYDTNCQPADACDGTNENNTCFNSNNHMTNEQCVGWGFGDGTVQDCPPHKSDGEGIATDDCYDKCTPTDACNSEMCYDSSIHMLKETCDDGWGLGDGTVQDCPPLDDNCYSNWVYNPEGNGWFNFGCVGGTGDDCSDGTIYDSILAYCEATETGGDCNDECYAAECYDWCYTDGNTSLILPADCEWSDLSSGTDGEQEAALTSHCPGTDYCNYGSECLTYDSDANDGLLDFMKRVDCDNWCLDGECNTCPANNDTTFINNCTGTNNDWMLQTSCEGLCNEGTCDNGYAYEDYMLKTACNGWGLGDGNVDQCPAIDNATFINNCTQADDNWMLQTDCNSTFACPIQTDGVNNGQNGTCFDSDTHMFDTECNGLCTNGECDGDYNSGNAMLSDECGHPTEDETAGWCLGGTCGSCPLPTDEDFLENCTGTSGYFMLETDCGGLCKLLDDGVGVGAYVHCDGEYHDYMQLSQCENWCVYDELGNGGNGSVSCDTCPPHKSDGEGIATHSCYNKCTPTDACDSEMCYDSTKHFNFSNVQCPDEEGDGTHPCESIEEYLDLDQNDDCNEACLNANCDWDNLTEERKADALTLHCPSTDYCQYDTQCLTYDGDDANSDPDFMKVSDCDVIDEDFTTDCLSKYPEIILQAGLEKSNYIAYLLPESKKISDALSLSGGWSNFDTIIGPKSSDPTDIASNTYLNGEWGFGDSGMLYPGMAYIIYSANGGVLTQVMGE